MDGGILSVMTVDLLWMWDIVSHDGVVILSVMTVDLLWMVFVSHDGVIDDIVSHDC